MNLVYVFLLTLSTLVLAQPREFQRKLEESISLTIGDKAMIEGIRIELLHINDDGCGRDIECYWIAYRDATFQVWQDDQDLGEITLSKASRDDSIAYIQLGDYYLILEDAIGYATEVDTATFFISRSKPNLEY
jgi:hypothetical protein